MLTCSNRFARWAGSLALACLAAALPGQAFAQAAHRPFADIDKEVKALRISVGDMLSAGTVKEQEFDRYFNLVMEQFVHPDQKANIHKLRLDTIKKSLRTAGNAPQDVAHQRLTAFLLQEMPVLIADEQQPSYVRSNAMAVLYELNSVELKGQQPATPLPAVLPMLIAAFNNANYTEELRILSQVGMLRHAEAGIEDQSQQNAVQNAMLDMLATAQLPAGWDEHALRWARLRASDILGALRLPGSDRGPAAVVEGLSKIVADAAAPIDIRSDAAESLGQLDYQAASGVNFSKLAELLARLELDLAGRKWTTLSDLQQYFLYVDASLRGVELGPREQPPATPNSIQGWAATTPHKDYVDKLVTEFDALSKVVKDNQNANALTEAAGMVDTLDGWLQNNPPAAAEVIAAN